MPAYLIPVDRGRPIVIDKAVIYIGRHPECDVVLTSSRKISRRHCCICQVNENLILRDLGSMNGVRLNGVRISREATLSLHDEITIGDILYKLQAQKEAPVSVAEVKEKKTPPVLHPADASLAYPVPIPEDDIEVPLSTPLDSHIQEISADEHRDYGESGSVNDFLPD